MIAFYKGKARKCQVKVVLSHSLETFILFVGIILYEARVMGVSPPQPPLQAPPSVNQSSRKQVCLVKQDLWFQRGRDSRPPGEGRPEAS